MKLENTLSSFLRVICFGAVIGAITELLNFLPNDDLWGWSSIAGSYGFWIFSTTFVICFSSSNLNAMINTFLYLSSMCSSYYLVQGIMDSLTPNVHVVGFLQWSHLLYWVGISAICGLVAFVLFCWNEKSAFGSVLYALPVAGMLIDTVNNCLKRYYSQTNLVNSILDVVFLLVMLIVFFKKAGKKSLFLITVVIVALVGYFTIFPKSQSLTTASPMICELNGITEEYYIKMRDDGVILEIRGNETVYEEIDIDSLESVPEVIHALQDYYESNGGTWKFE